jgi:hypothetical protein
MEKDYGIPTSAAGNRLTSQPTERNLTMPTNFRFVLPRVPNAVYFCQSVSFPNTSCPQLNVATGWMPLKLPGSEVSHENLTFTFLVDEDMTNYREIQEWFRKLLAMAYASESVFPAKDWLNEQCQLIMLSNKKEPLIKFTFSGVFPTNLSALSFDNTDTEGKFTTATVTLGFTYYRMESF